MVHVWMTGLRAGFKHIVKVSLIRVAPLIFTTRKVRLHAYGVRLPVPRPYALYCIHCTKLSADAGVRTAINSEVKHQHERQGCDRGTYTLPIDLLPPYVLLACMKPIEM